MRLAQCYLPRSARRLSDFASFNQVTAMDTMTTVDKMVCHCNFFFLFLGVIAQLSVCLCVCVERDIAPR